MEVFKYLLNKKIYLLINILILFIGYLLIDYGLSLIGEDQKASNVYVSIGTSLIAAGIVIFLDLWKNITIGKLLEKIKNIINDSGLNYIYKKRDIDAYDTLIDNMKHGIDICGYSLAGFFDSFSETVITKAKTKDVRIRVIFVDYNSQASQHRAAIEGKSTDLFKERFNTFVDHFSGIQSIEIRTIDTPLSTMIFRIDDFMFIGPHFYKKQSKSTITMELKRGKWVFDEYQSEFERMWKDAKSI